MNPASIVGGQGSTARIRQHNAPRLASKGITASIDDRPVEKLILRGIGEAKGPLGCSRGEVGRRFAQAKGVADTTTRLQVGTVDRDSVLTGLLDRVCDSDPNRHGTIVVDLRKSCRHRGCQSKKTGRGVGDELHGDG